MSRQIAAYTPNDYRLIRQAASPAQTPFGPIDVDDDVWTWRNTLNLKESTANYFDELKSLILLFDRGNTLATTTTDWLTAVSNAVTAAELKALNEFVSDVGATVLAKIVRFNPFVGTNATARTTPLIGASTDTLVATPTWTTTLGYTLNGTSQYVTSGVAVSGIGTGIGGLGVYYSAGLTAANQTLIGAKDSVNGNFSIDTLSTGPETRGYFGGTANFTTVATVLTAQTDHYLHIERTGATALEYYSDGASGNTQATSTSVTSANDNIYVGARNNDGTADAFTAGSVGCYCLTNGTLSDANVLTLSTAVNNLMGRLGRR